MASSFTRRVLIILLMTLTPYTIFGQTTKRDTVVFSALKSAGDDKNTYMIDPGMGVTGLNCKVIDGSSFDSVYIVAAGDTIHPTADMERGIENGYLSSELIIFRNKVSTFTLHAGSDLDHIIFFYIDASMPEKKTDEGAVKKKVQAVPNPR